MSNKYQILNEQSEVINTIIATQDFVEQHYPGKWVLIPEPEPVVPPIEGWPVITKFEFRQLLTNTQKLVWDNFDLMKDALALTDMQFMQLRSFKADFDSAQLVTMDSPLMVGGLGTMASWNLTLDGQVVFTQADVDRILAGQGPE